MKKLILCLLVCSPFTLLANDQIPVDDSAPTDYVYAYERPGKRAPATTETVTVVKAGKEVVEPKKKAESKQR
jgi:hypothetical protein